MPDLERRFRGADQIPAPPLWAGIERRQPSSSPPAPSPARRGVIAAFALGIAIAAIAFAVRAIDGGAGPRPISEPTPLPIVPHANGQILFRIGGGDGGSWTDTIQPDGSGRRRFIAPEAYASHPAWSPDGTTVAYVALVEGGSTSADGEPHYAIFEANADGSDPREVSRGINDRWPAWLSWSPDGTRIAFSSLPVDAAARDCRVGGDGWCPTDLYVMDADGSDLTRLTSTSTSTGEFQPAWSPDGSQIAFAGQVRPRDGLTGIFVMNADGTDVRTIASTSQGSSFAPSWSPDGSQLVFSSIRAENWNIYVVNEDGSAEHPLLTQQAYVEDAVWSPDGTMIAFRGEGGLAGGGGDTALYVMRPDGTGITELADEPGNSVAGDIAWQPVPVIPQASPEASEVAATIETVPHLSPFPNAVAIGEGGVWISAPRNDGSGGGDVVRLDPRSAEVVARIPAEHLPGWETGGGGLAAGEGSVWSMGIDRVGGELHTIVDRIDPSTNQVVEEIDLGAGSGGDVWASDGNLWAVRFTDVPNTLEVARFDLAQDRVVARVSIPGEWSQEIFTYGDAVWVSALTTGSDGAFGGTGSEHLLIEIDGATDSYVGQTSCDCGVLASSGPVMWAWLDHELHRYDAASGADLGPAAATPAPGSQLVADGEGGVWTFLADGGGARGEFEHIDAGGRSVAAGAIGRDDVAMWGGVAAAFDPETQSLWFVHYEDMASVVRVR